MYIYIITVYIRIYHSTVLDLSLHAVLIPFSHGTQVAGPTCGNMAKDICVSDRSHVPKSSVFSLKATLMFLASEQWRNLQWQKTVGKKNGKRCGKTHCIVIRLQLWPASVAFSGKNTKQTSENNWEWSLPMNQVLDYWKTAVSSALMTWNTTYFACCQLTVPDMI